MEPVRFTSRIGFAPTPLNIPEPWQTLDSFEWLLDYHDPSAGSIIVHAGFSFDGASVPKPLTLIFPRVHRCYMQSAALHDWCLKNERHRFTREEIDLIFREALTAQQNPEWRVNGMYLGVSSFGKARDGSGYRKLIPLAQQTATPNPQP